MKSKIALSSLVLFLLIIAVGCGTLNRDSNSLYLNHTIPGNSRLLIELEDKSGFDIDVENSRGDSLVLERQGLANLPISDGSVTAKIEANTAAALANPSKKSVKVRVRVYNHKSKVKNSVIELKR